MRSKIKVLIICKNIEGGTGSFLTKFLKLSRLSDGTKIETINLILEKPRYTNIGNNNYIFYENKDYSQKRFFLSPILTYKFISQLIWCMKTFNTFRPDIILSVDIHCNLLTQFIKLISFRRVKTILTTHNNLSMVLKNKSSLFAFKLLKGLIFFLYNNSDYLIGISRGVSRSLTNDFKIRKKVQIIYYGLTSKDIGVKKKGKKKKILLSIGRLDMQKDFQTLLNSFSLLRSRYRDLELWIAGEGPLKRDLIELSNKLNINKRVKFLGWVENINKLLMKADIFVLSSKWEGFGYAILEAMTNGLPVVCSDSPYGPREILDDGKYGLLFPVGNARRLVSQLEKLLENDKRYAKFSILSLKRSLFFNEKKMLEGYNSAMLSLLRR